MAGARLEPRVGARASWTSVRRRLCGGGATLNRLRFLHKDSAALLPLDGLKKLGTSKEGQPHNILQRRLLEATLSRNRMNNRNLRPPNNHMVQSHSMHSGTQEAETDLIQVKCQCFGQDMILTVDTGCIQNMISSVSVEYLGFKEKIISNKNEDHLGQLQHNLQNKGHIKLSLVIGQTETDLLFTVVETKRMFISLGTKTLKFLKCVIDTEKQMLVFGNSVREQVHFVGKRENEVSIE